MPPLGISADHVIKFSVRIKGGIKTPHALPFDGKRFIGRNSTVDITRKDELVRRDPVPTHNSLDRAVYAPKLRKGRYLDPSPDSRSFTLEDNQQLSYLGIISIDELR